MSRPCTFPVLAPASLLLAATLAGCGGSSNPGSTPAPTPVPTGPTTPSVTVTPASTTLTNAQTLAISVSVSGSPAGTVVLSSGNYATFPATLSSSGTATFTLPAGVLATGTDTLTASFTSGALSTVNSATGTASLAVTAAQTTAPTVTATPVTIPVAGRPFRALPLSSGQVLVSVSNNTEGIQLLSPSPSGLTAGCVNVLGSNLLNANASAFSMALSPSASTVGLAVDNSGVTFFSTADLTSCNATGNGYVVPQGPVSSGEGTIGVAFSPDGKFAFVANEYGIATGATSMGNVGVIALTTDPTGHSTGTLLGQISTGGQAIAGITVSPDGTRLYVTSEITTSSTPSNTAGASNPTLTHNTCVQQTGSTPTANGILTVIDAAKAEASPSQSSIIATVNAGCAPTRAVESADNTTLYISARGDNNVLVFSTGMLELNPGNALLAAANSGGTAPVGLQLFHGGKLLAVANSNRFGAGPNANSTILNVAVPTAPTVVQTIPTGLFPREWSLASDDSTLYLSNFMSNTLEVIPTTVQ